MHMSKEICHKFLQLMAITGLFVSFCLKPAFASSNRCSEIYRGKTEQLTLGSLQKGSLHQRAEEIRSRLFAVHATVIFPKDGVLIAGARDLRTNKTHVASEPPSFRPTVHFSLGELVRSHRGGDWDQSPYAVVLPLRSIENQLVNIHPYDSFVLGNFKIPPEAILVIPESEVHRVPPGLRYVTYESGTPLRRAIDKVIADNGGWKVTMQNQTDIWAPAEVNGKNINSKDFFEPLLRENPFLTYGNHLHAEVGGIYRMGNIEQALHSLMREFAGHGIGHSYEMALFKEEFIRYHLYRLDTYLASANLPDHSMDVYQKKRRNVLDWLNIVKMEKVVNQGYGLTLMESDKVTFGTLELLKGDPQKLSQYVEDLVQSNKLKQVREGNSGRPTELAEYFTASSPSEVRELLSRHPKVLKAEDVDLFWLLYSVNRTLAFNKSIAKSEGLFELMDYRVSALITQRNGQKAMDALFDTFLGDLSSTLDHSSPRLPLALELLSRPLMRDFLRSQGMELPSRPTLEDVIRSHPETKMLFAEKGLPYKNKREEAAYKVLQLLKKRRNHRSDQSLNSFSEAHSAFMEQQFVAEQIQKDIAQMMKPLRKTRPLDSIPGGERLTLYELILRGDHGSLDEVAQKLGISSNFRKAFPDDHSFWHSPLSLLEMYEG
ncbi:MAG: hypothetical protein AB7H97_08490, partial [Pseudobdellovibrionaceae bacterium]